MEQAIMATGVVLVGLVTLGLTMQVINLVRMQTTLRRVETLEARILARLLMAETQEATEILMDQEIPETTPVTLEDLIRMDLEEQMGMDPDLMTPATDQDVLAVLKATMATGTETSHPQGNLVATIMPKTQGTPDEETLVTAKADTKVKPTTTKVYPK